MPEHSQLWYIANTDLFTCLSPSDRQEMAVRSRMMAMKKGESLRNSLAPDNHIYLIKEGVVKIVASSQRGKEVILGFLQAGDLLGEAALSDIGPEETDAIAEEEVLLCEFDCDYFHQILARHPELAMSITKWFGLRLQRIQRRFQNLLFATPKERVATALLEISEDFGKRLPQGRVRIGLKLTHQEIAQLIGLTRESVTHVLGDMESEGLIETNKRVITITDTKLLQNLENPHRVRI